MRAGVQTKQKQFYNMKNLNYSFNQFFIVARFAVLSLAVYAFGWIITQLIVNPQIFNNL